MKRLEACCDETGLRAEISDIADLPDGWVQIIIAVDGGSLGEFHFSSYQAMASWASRRHTTTNALAQRRALDDAQIRTRGRAA